MPVVILRIKANREEDSSRPLNCPECGSGLLQGWGSGAKIVKGNESAITQIHRYRCNSCHHTFRYYPSGLDRTHLSPAVRRLAAIAWTLGMSSRDVAAFFTRFGIQLSHSTVWRDGHTLIAQRGAHEASSPLNRFNLDDRFLPGISNRLGVVIALDLGAGRVSVLGTVDEYNPRKVTTRLKMLVDDFAEVVTTETKSFSQALGRANV
jgi:hypothetical protein